MGTEQASALAHSSVFRTLEEMDAEVAAERAAGREVLPYDDPERGVVGYVAFNQWPGGDETPPEGWDEGMRRLEWPVFGKPLVPEVVLTQDCGDMIRVLDEEGDYVMQASDPIQRHVGIVSYAMASEGRCSVIRLPMGMLMAADPAVKKRIMEVLRPETVMASGMERLFEIAGRVSASAMS